MASCFVLRWRRAAIDGVIAEQVVDSASFLGLVWLSRRREAGGRVAPLGRIARLARRLAGQVIVLARFRGFGWLQAGAPGGCCGRPPLVLERLEVRSVRMSGSAACA